MKHNCDNYYVKAKRIGNAPINQTIVFSLDGLSFHQRPRDTFQRIVFYPSKNYSIIFTRRFGKYEGTNSHGLKWGNKPHKLKCLLFRYSDKITESVKLARLFKTEMWRFTIQIDQEIFRGLEVRGREAMIEIKQA